MRLEIRQKPECRDPELRFCSGSDGKTRRHLSDARAQSNLQPKDCSGLGVGNEIIGSENWGGGVGEEAVTVTWMGADGGPAQGGGSGWR